MGKDAAQAPVPDFYGLANQQGQINQQAALTNTSLGQPNQSNPYGSQTWKYNGDPSKLNAQGAPAGQTFDPSAYQAAVLESQATGAPAPDVNSFIKAGAGSSAGTNFNPGDWSLNTTLDPSQQKLLDAQNAGKLGISGLDSGLISQAQQALSGPQGLSGLQGVDNLNYDPNQFSAEGKQAQDAAFKSQTALLDPQYQEAQRALASSLQGQGVSLGSDAYDRAISQFSNNKANAYDQIAANAVGIGNTQANAMQTQRLNTILGQQGLQTSQLQNRQSTQTAPLANLATILGLSGPTVPQFGAVNAGTTAAGNLQSAGQQALSANQGNAAAQNAMTGGYTSAAASILAAYLGRKT